MKKLLAFLLIFIVLLGCLCGCKETRGDVISNYYAQVYSQGSVTSEDILEHDIYSTYYPFYENSSQITTSNPNNVTTSNGGTTASNPSNTTESKQPSNSVSSEEEVISIAPMPSEQVQLNTEFIEVVGGLTFKQLTKKYGDVVDVFYDGYWSAVYKFEKTDVWYGFRDLDWGKDLLDPDVWPSVPTDENGQWIFSEAPRPKKNAVCNSIYNIKVSDIITNLKSEVDVTGLDEFSDLELIGGNNTSDYNSCTFLLNNKQYIDIEVDKNFAIWPQARVYKIKLYADIMPDEE